MDSPGCSEDPFVFHKRSQRKTGEILVAERNDSASYKNYNIQFPIPVELKLKQPTVISV